RGRGRLGKQGGREDRVQPVDHVLELGAPLLPGVRQRVLELLAHALPYPRQERSPEFEDMVDRLHAILTATLLPEPAPAAPQRLIPFPRVHVSEVTGLLDHLLTR